MFYIRYLLSLLIMLSVIPVELVYAGENIPIDRLSQAVVETVKKQFPGAELREAERNEEQGQPIYELDISVNGAKKEVEVTPKGKIIEVGAGD